MKKFLNILIVSCFMILIMSGNPNHDAPALDTGLQPYEKILQLSKKLPQSQRALILQWIKNDQVINMRLNYYQSMTNYKP